MDAQHHLHIRKRIHEQKETYPHPTLWKRWLDYAVLVVGVGAPLMTFVQVFKIWSGQNAEGLSLHTWIAYFVASLIWLFYGLVHRVRPILISNIMYLISTGLVLIGIALF